MSLLFLEEKFGSSSNEEDNLVKNSERFCVFVCVILTLRSAHNSDYTESYCPCYQLKCDLCSGTSAQHADPICFIKITRLLFYLSSGENSCGRL